MQCPKLKKKWVFSFLALFVVSTSSYATTTAEYEFCEVLELVQKEHVETHSDEWYVETLQKALVKTAKQFKLDLTDLPEIKVFQCLDIFSKISQFLLKVGVDSDPFRNELLLNFVGSLDPYSKYTWKPQEEESASTSTKDEFKILDSDIGYIRLSAFRRGVSGIFIEQLSHWAAEKRVSGIVLDLRNNSGGHVEEALSILGVLLSEEILLKQRFRDQIISIHGEGKTLFKFPMVVLINQNTQSAGEMVAGVLQFYKRAKLIGQTTKGKGTMQKIWDLTHLWSKQPRKLILTHGYFLLPNEKGVHAVGIKPDLETKEDELDAPFQIKLSTTSNVWVINSVILGND